MRASAPERTALYRLYDADERLLYVGISSRPQQRMRQHSSEKLWWPEVTRREVEWFSSRDLAATAEVEVIESQGPLYNTTRTPERLKHYQLIAGELRERIRDGRLPSGSKLPSENVLAKEFTTTRATVRKGLALLRAEGLIESSQGKGAFVKAPGEKGLRSWSEIRPEVVTDPDRVAAQREKLDGAALDDEVVRLRALLARVRHLLVDDDELFNGGVERAIKLLSAFESGGQTAIGA